MAGLALRLLVLCVVGTSISAQDPCTTYQPLASPEARSVRNVVDPSTVPLLICDRSLVETWYRATSLAGETMATSCPPMNSCGTTNQVWMDDTLNVPDGVTLTKKVCLATFDACCASSWQIQVRNCSTFLVFRLPPTPSCPQTYCIGTEVPCPQGQCSHTGFTPNCVTACTNVTIEPEVVADLELTKKQDRFSNIVDYYNLIFRCDFEEKEPDLAYDVTWIINGFPVKSFQSVLVSEINSTYLREVDWKQNYSFGMLVKCEMKARVQPGTPATRPFESKPFFAGLQVWPLELTVREGETQIIYVNSTVPLSCQTRDGCRVNVYVNFASYQKSPDTCQQGLQPGDLLMEAEDCGVIVQSSTWNQSEELKVTGYADRMYNRQNRELFVKMESKDTSRPGWDGQSLPEVKVTVVDRDSTLRYTYCHYSNDPYLTMFDGWGLYQPFVGEHILYEHKRLPIRVHAVSAKCSPDTEGTCTCGLAIRSYESLLVVNYCQENISYTTVSGPYNSYMEQRLCDDTHMIIEQLYDQNYRVTLPTGTTVTWWIGQSWRAGRILPNFIQIRPSFGDIGVITGLCGNGSSWEDYTGSWWNRPMVLHLRNGGETSDENIFFSNWQLPENSPISLFRYDVDLSVPEVNVRYYCNCARQGPGGFSVNENEVHCNLTEAVQLCTNLTRPRDRIPNTCQRRRSRRDTSEADILPQKYGIVYDPEVFTTVPKPLEWRAPWNESTARALCEEAFSNSTATGLCIRMFGDTVIRERNIMGCISDIKVTGGTLFVEAAVESYKTICLREAGRNETLQESTDPVFNFTLLLASLCPRNCSNRGACRSGTCECLSGFVGSDCSVNVKQPPQHLDLADLGLCDVKKRPCQSTSVTAGANIPLDGSSVHCGVTYFKVLPDGTVARESNRSVHPAVHNVAQNVQCPLPPRASSDAVAQGYSIALSNDGINFGDSLDVIIYDSKCWTCNITSVTCIANGQCPSTMPATTNAVSTAQATNISSSTSQPYANTGSQQTASATPPVEISSTHSSNTSVSTETGTPSPTGTGTPSPTGTGTPSPTGTGTPSPTGTGTPSPTGTGTPSPTGTGTPSPTGTGTPSPTGTGTPSPTGTGTPSPTGTGTPSPTGTGTPSPTGTGTPPAGTGTHYPADKSGSGYPYAGLGTGAIIGITVAIVAGVVADLSQ